MKRFFAASLLLAYVAFGGLGFLLMAGMDHHVHDVNCPFMPGKKVVCDMNIFEHVSAWKGMFVATIPLSSIIAGLFLLLAAYQGLLQVFASPRRLLVPIDEYLIEIFDRREYRLAFSRGIIHSKNP